MYMGIHMCLYIYLGGWTHQDSGFGRLQVSGVRGLGVDAILKTYSAGSTQKLERFSASGVRPRELDTIATRDPAIVTRFWEADVFISDL